MTRPHAEPPPRATRHVTPRCHSLILGLLCCSVISIISTRRAICDGQSFEGYYLRSATYPIHADLGDREIQGVTHDRDNWYFTWTNNDPNIGYLSRVPLGIPLDNCVLGAKTPCNPNQLVVNMSQFPDLNGGIVGRPLPSGQYSRAGYWHWGDPDHYRVGGVDYIVVPITATPVCSNKLDANCRADCECPGGSCEPQSPIIAIFRGKDLSLVAYGRLAAQSSTGWCAIHPVTGELYTSEDFDYAAPKTCGWGTNVGNRCRAACECPTDSAGLFAPCGGEDCDNQEAGRAGYRRELLRYRIPWTVLPAVGYLGEVDLTPVTPRLELVGAQGGFLELYNMQGGEFSPSGERLYISAGSGCCQGRGAGQECAFDGLYVFDTEGSMKWHTITRSNNHDCRNAQLCPRGLARYFDYFYISGECDACTLCFGGAWSPEGLTVWDLDGGADKNIGGQLHVLGYHCQVGFSGLSCSDNEVIFEHFGSRIHVATDGVDRPLPPELGSGALPGGSEMPFNTFGFALGNYPVWDGAEVVLGSGHYPESGRFAPGGRVHVVSRGGAATIGK